MTRAELIERLEKATGPDRELDREIAQAAGLTVRLEASPGTGTMVRIYGRKNGGNGLVKGNFTSSLDAAIALVKRVLPGWAWKVGTCSVSDDAWMSPDFSCPVHGERLKAELGYETMKAGDLLDTGIDIDQRPPGRPAIALCIALLRALEAKDQRT